MLHVLNLLTLLSLDLLHFVVSPFNLVTELLFLPLYRLVPLRLTLLKPSLYLFSAPGLLLCSLQPLLLVCSLEFGLSLLQISQPPLLLGL